MGERQFDSGQINWWQTPPTLKNRLKQKNQNMKTLTKLTLAVAMLLTAVSANAQSYHSGSSRDYVYRNPYAATPSVRVHNYFRQDGTYVPSHMRTSPNWTPTDNLNYRGYRTIRVPRSW
jgi:hypothetical protein